MIREETRKDKRFNRNPGYFSFKGALTVVFRLFGWFAVLLHQYSLK